ncbi:MAG: hypothetical protein ABR505_05765 [Actinomycetota bacterium]
MFVGALFLFGLYIFGISVAAVFLFARNLCGDGCGRDSLVLASVATFLSIGFFGTAVFCRRKRYSWWPETVVNLMIYAWLLGLPTFFFVVLIASGPP